MRVRDNDNPFLTIKKVLPHHELKCQYRAVNGTFLNGGSGTTYVIPDLLQYLDNTNQGHHSGGFPNDAHRKGASIVVLGVVLNMIVQLPLDATEGESLRLILLEHGRVNTPGGGLDGLNLQHTLELSNSPYWGEHSHRLFRTRYFDRTYDLNPTAQWAVTIDGNSGTPATSTLIHSDRCVIPIYREIQFASNDGDDGSLPTLALHAGVGKLSTTLEYEIGVHIYFQDL